MNQPLGAADFFALEAGETLDRLDGLLSRPDAPSGDDLLRASRVLRGAALMASQQPIARAAGGLEAFARALRDGQRQWDPAAREQVAQAIEEFRLLVRRARDWAEADTARAARLARSLESLGGQAPAEDERREARGTIDAGIRAFVAREGALIASALDRAARALQVAPSDREPLYAVIRRMQSLRGLAELGELSPLPEMLDAVELAIGDLTRLFAPPPGRRGGHGRRGIRLDPDRARRGRPGTPRPRRGGSPPLHRASAARLRGGARRGRRSRRCSPTAIRSRPHLPRRSPSSPRPPRWVRSSW